MGKNMLGTNIVTQIGFVVNDIEKTAQAFADFLGLEKPLIVITNVYDLAQTEYKGEPTQARAKQTFFKVGSTLDIELIEPDHEPSTWRDYLDKKGEGVHHIAFIIKGMKEKIMLLGENGMPLLQRGEKRDRKGRYAYFDTVKELKTVIELLENDLN